MAAQAPLQHLQNTATALAAVAAAPGLLGGAPQWAIDMENRLCHQQQWDAHILKISFHNLAVSTQEQAEWNAARFLNSVRSKDVDPLTALPAQFQRVVVPAIPLPPAPGPGAVVDLPAPFIAPPIVVPAAPALFPVGMAALHGLNAGNLTALLVAYGLPGQNLPVNQKRVIFARHIGVVL
ncbi:hypothetical protein B0H15DRAFT_933608 [Mycena belliarum]|uniref:Uncharacterized protein n=1 Tax=Mycena belliarum TaxID=1033014 RepID=A0AAD6XPQ5_9AGAR|nr:hypothetical protein B0H15DRAFT_933608 [Mycena belliae]